MAHGTPLQKQVFAANEFNGRWAGTMACPSRRPAPPVDIATRALPDGEAESDPLGPRYRLKGNKMWISSGDHELTENIVHLVLAKIPGPDGKLIPA
jgi:butyryl-CoA dehydrogenase